MTLGLRFVRLPVLLLLPFLASGYSQAEIAFIDRLIEKWAPLVWLAPGERYLPLSVDEFLEHVYPADANGRSVSNSLPLSPQPDVIYLITKRNLDSLKNESSFLYGKDPRKIAVPVYVTVTECCQKCKFNTIPKNVAHVNISHLFFHLSYWMFYPYNEGKEICFIGRFPTPFIFNTCFGKTRNIGDHVGDFEHVSLSFKGKIVPDEMFLSVHDIGVYYKYDEVSKIFRYNRQIIRKGLVQKPKFPSVVKLWKNRPILFAALGSHGLWSAPGEHYFVKLPKLHDNNGFGIPWLTWKQLEIYHLGFTKPPVWMKYIGRWGNPKSNCFPFQKFGICELSDGPWGILRRKQDFYC